MNTPPNNVPSSRWFVAFTFALVIQAALFGYWAGSLNASVAALTRTVTELRQDVANHIDKR